MPDVEGCQMGMSLVYQQRGRKDCGESARLARIKSRSRNLWLERYRGALTRPHHRVSSQLHEPRVAA